MRYKITAAVLLGGGIVAVLAGASQIPAPMVMFAVGINLAVTAPVFWVLSRWRADRRDLMRLFELLVEEMANRPTDLERR